MLQLALNRKAVLDTSQTRNSKPITMQELTKIMHLYLGCEVEITKEVGGMHLLGYEVGQKQVFTPSMLQAVIAGVLEVKLLCYSLSDLTEEHAKELAVLKFPWLNISNLTTYQNDFEQIVVSWGKGNFEKYIPLLDDKMNAAQFTQLLLWGYFIHGQEYFDKGLVINKKQYEKQ